MIITCAECKKEMSDSLAACPHCGFIRTGAPLALTQKAAATKRSATFQFIALGAVVVALFTPRFLVTIPCLVVISSAIAALIRREPRWLLSTTVLLLGFWMVGASPISTDDRSDYVQKLRVDDFRWDTEGTYTYARGRVTNTGDKIVSYFSVTAYYKDASGKVLNTEYTNSGQDLGPGISKEFQIMHKTSPEYSSVSVAVNKASTR
jgi:hypothetical protein